MKDPVNKIFDAVEGVETLLETRFGVQGVTLHERVSAVESILPAPLVKKLRFIATVGNKLAAQSEAKQEKTAAKEAGRILITYDAVRKEIAELPKDLALPKPLRSPL